MRKLLPIAVSLALAGSLMAQVAGLTLPPSGNNQKASVSQYIGPVKVSIDYSSPAVHGPDGKDRRGQIWGKLVPYGMANLGFGNGKPSPWRAGANENTVFTVSHDVKVEGKPLAAGRYGLHMIPGADEWTLIFSASSGAWGSFFYEESQDALRVTVKPHKHDYREWLTYEFTERKPEYATAEMQWEDLAVGWKIEAPDNDAIYVSALKKELTSVPGFHYEGFLGAAQYCVMTGKHLDLGLEWAEAAISRPFIGKENFRTLSVKSQVLAKMGRDEEAKKVMLQALKHPTASPTDIHQYARQLQLSKRGDEALEIFRLNGEKHGDVWPVHVGLARMYSAKGDLPAALEHARKALPQAPDELNRKSLEGMIESLSEGKPIAQ